MASASDCYATRTHRVAISFDALFHLCDVGVNLENQCQCNSAEVRVKVNYEMGQIKLTKACVCESMCVCKKCGEGTKTWQMFPSFLTTIPIALQVDQYESTLFQRLKGYKRQTVISAQPSIWINDLMRKALWQALIVSTLLLVHHTVVHWCRLILSITVQGPLLLPATDPVNHW